VPRVRAGQREKIARPRATRAGRAGLPERGKPVFLPLPSSSASVRGHLEQIVGRIPSSPLPLSPEGRGRGEGPGDGGLLRRLLDIPNAPPLLTALEEELSRLRDEAILEANLLPPAEAHRPLP